MKTISIFLILGFLFISNAINAKEIRISSLSELAEYASQSGNVITMQAGVYQMEDYLTPDVGEAFSDGHSLTLTPKL